MFKFLKALKKIRLRPLLCMSGTEKKRDDGEKKTAIAAEEQEREREAHSKLLTEHNKMVKKWLREKKSLKASLAEAEGKHEQTMQTIAQLESENSNMKSQVEKLREKLQDVESETFRTCDMLFEDSLAEAKKKDQKAVETIARLETENSDLTSQVEEMQKTVNNVMDLLSKSSAAYKEIMNDYQQERDAHSNLLFEYNEMTNTWMHQMNSLKDSLEEAKEKGRKAVETIAQLESENFVLTNQVEALRKTVQVSETCWKCDRLTKECAQTASSLSSTHYF